MRWFQDGRPIEVTVDDWFPCDPATGRPAFSHAKVQPAFASCHQSAPKAEMQRMYGGLMRAASPPSPHTHPAYYALG